MKADHCEVARYHRPKPSRYILHHVQPQAAGGQTVPANLAQLCDNCHYTVHRVLWAMAKGLPIPECTRAQRAIAQRGYDACVAAGTVDKIPNEG